MKSKQSSLAAWMFVFPILHAHIVKKLSPQCIMIQTAAIASASSSSAPHGCRIFRRCFSARNLRTAKFSNREVIMPSTWHATFGTSAMVFTTPEPYFTNANEEKIFQKNKHWLTTVSVSTALGVAVGSQQDPKKLIKLDDDNNSSKKMYSLTTSFSHNGTYFENNYSNVKSKSHSLQLELDGTALKMKKTIAVKSDINRSLGIRKLHHSIQQYHDRQKFKLGRLLHDLHFLVEEALATKESVQSNHVPSREKEELSHEANTIIMVDEAKYSNGDGYIHIKEQELTKLTPVAAWEYTNCLKEGRVFT